jgi:hypothetical protein
MTDLPLPPPEESTFWCNFCGYRTENPQDYLAHSCVEVLERSGRPPEEPGASPHCR